MRIMNLCSEREYDASKFGGPKHACRFPFDDHNPAPLVSASAHWPLLSIGYEISLAL